MDWVKFLNNLLNSGLGGWIPGRPRHGLRGWRLGGAAGDEVVQHDFRDLGTEARRPRGRERWCTTNFHIYIKRACSGTSVMHDQQRMCHVHALHPASYKLVWFAFARGRLDTNTSRRAFLFFHVLESLLVFMQRTKCLREAREDLSPVNWLLFIFIPIWFQILGWIVLLMSINSYYLLIIMLTLFFCTYTSGDWSRRSYRH